MLIIDCDVLKLTTSSQILTLTFCAWSLFTTCNLFSKAGMHIYARAVARGKRVQSNIGGKNHAIIMPDASMMIL